MENVVIIGGGAAGLSAGIYLARSGLKPFIYAGSPPGGQLTLTSDVENFPGYESILGPDLIEKMRAQVLKFGGKIVNENVQTIDLKETVKSVQATQTKSVLIATGAKALWLNIPSEQKLRGKGVSACATCDGFFFRNKTVAVVGGGDSALEEALTLTKFASKVYIIHRRDSFKASKIMQSRVLVNAKIEVLWNSGVEEILGEHKVTGIKTRSIDSVSRTIELDGVFIAIGHKPDTDLFKGKIEMDQKGYIITTARAGWELMKNQEVKKTLFNTTYQTGASVKGVFAAGDCVDYVYRQAATASGMGVQAALDVERWLEEN